MTTFFTADLHLDHANIIKHCKRPFDHVATMDWELTARWNDVVTPSDQVFILGDFLLGKKDRARFFLSRLKGQIFLVPGGHDESWLRKNEVYETRNGTLTILPALITIKPAPKTPVVLCHYPLRTWEQSNYGHTHLHGHSHGRGGVIRRSGDVGTGWSIDVGVDSWFYEPVSWEMLQLTMAIAEIG